jgi:outer membrane receptor protein involved in Fe transport
MRTSMAVLATLVLLGVAPALAQQTQLPGIVVNAPPPAKKTPVPPPPASAAAAAAAPPASSPDVTAVQAIDPSTNDVGKAQSGSQGMVTREQLEARPIYRTGEVLEAVPGLVVTQHSGEGKANQYFLRGFNLDHGTDLAIYVDGMPVNMRTHAHGQGYADTNFLIPELAQGLAYRKGPYYASEGDFASAGAIYLDIVDRLDKNFAQIEYGSFGHQRMVTGASVPVGPTGTLLAAGEVVRFDGPWERSDDLRKLNGVLRYSQGSYLNGFAITGMAYSGSWHATDQIPQRAVDQGLISRFGTLDPTDGGFAHRYSLSARWNETTAESATRVNAYVVKSDLALFNNFTYFLNNPVDGDQFKQSDGRLITGGSASQTFFATNAYGVKSETTIGVQTRYDSIHAGLFDTKDRTVLSTVRDDQVSEFSVGVYGEQTLRWTPWLRTTTGIRADFYSANVASNLVANSGSDLGVMISPKLGLVLGPWAKTELYLNAGTGFHSNDARGTVTTVDPVTFSPVAPSPFLVRSKGAEVGLRTQSVKDTTSTFAVFLLDFDSEIVFVGDAGTTEASGPSRRIGAEYTLRNKLTPWIWLDLDAAYTYARFLEDDPAAPGRYIPGATEGVVSAALNFDNVWGGWFGGVRVRYFGPRPLIEDNSVRSGPSAPVSARLGYKFDDGLIVRVDGFNLLNQQSHQIDYYYASRLAAEPAEVDDIHFHPLEPRSFRLTVRKEF